MACCGQALKLPKAPEQLSKALALHNLLRHRTSPYRPHKLFLLGFETPTWHVLGIGQALKPLKPPQQLWEALAPHNRPPALPSYLPIGPTNCFCWASKLLHGTVWAGLKTSKTPAAAFEGFSTAQPSACFAIIRPHRPYKLFLLGFETATWHVLGKP